MVPAGNIDFVDSGSASLRSAQIDNNLGMRVLHVHPGNLFGGIESMLLTQAQQRDSVSEMDNAFALCFAGRFSQELEAENIPVHWLGEVRISQPLSIRRARRKLSNLLRTQRFDVVVTHSCWAQAIFAPVVRNHDVDLVFTLHAPATGRHWLERWARRSRPDKVVCNSQYTASTLHHLYPDVPNEIVYCPVASFTGAPADKQKIRAELGTAIDATVIIQVSRMEPWKGQQFHLEALSLLKNVPGWVFWLVGGAQTTAEVNFEKELKSVADRLGIGERVRFLGERNDVAELLSAADIFCQPNTGAEPFGITFVEALYSGLPVVATKLGGAREIVDDSCGLLVEPNNSKALAHALKLLIEDESLRRQLGDAGVMRATKLCDPVSQMRRLHRFFAE